MTEHKTAGLHALQTKVHVAKNKENTHGNYMYRTAEGILSAIKAALPEGATITCTDSLQELAGQIFVTSIATVRFADGECHSVEGHAMHPLSRKGMDPSQITGACSSYARKYALGGLMALDDGSADPDSKEKYAPDPEAEAAPFIAQIESAMSGQALLAVLKSIGSANNLPLVAAARVEQIRKLVKGAAGVPQLEAFAKHFAKDWAQVQDDAARRKIELTAPKPEPQEDTEVKLQDHIPY